MALTLYAEQARRIARVVLPKRTFRRISGLVDAAAGIRKIGWHDYRRLRDIYPDRCTPNGANVSFSFPGLLFPLTLRPGTSDPNEVMQVVVRNLYGHFLPEPPIRFIVDAGAYIGDSAAYYLSRHSEARVVSLEPDPENFQMAQANLRPYGDRVRLLQAGLWYRDAKLIVSNTADKSGISVEEAAAEANQYTCKGVSPLSLLQDLETETIDIFKCDIEGAEYSLFGSDCDAWISRVRSIYIEIHGQAAYKAVLQMTTRHGFSHQVFRNIHVFKHS